MRTKAEARTLRSFEELEHHLGLFAMAHEQPAPAHPWHGWRAATLARRAGACDHLIAAALVHDFSSRVGYGLVADCGTNSAALLVDIFPTQVLAPLRLLDDNRWRPRSEAPRHAGTASVSQAERLRQYVRTAQVQDGHQLLQLRSLLNIARRASLNG